MIFVEQTDIIAKDSTYTKCELEKYTGADLMVSNFDAPALTESLIDKHLEDGAILIQVKQGHDLLASVYDGRLDIELCRMNKITFSSAQRVLLTIGEYGGSFDEDNSDYNMYIRALSKWCDRGGVVFNIPSIKQLNMYLYIRQAQLKEYADKKETIFIPNTPLQNLLCVSDWRLSLVTFPMIGIERANAVKKVIIENGFDNTLYKGIDLVTATDGIKVPGIGDTIKHLCRDWMGLPYGWNLDIKPDTNLI